MRILIATDAFPPTCGGSGWSTWELARGLRARGHEIVVAQPRPATRGIRTRGYDDFVVHEFGSPAPALPFVRNYFKNERLTSLLTPWLTGLVHEHRVDILHAQHVLTGPATIDAARASGRPVVCTIRDYWPVCYWSDLIVDPGQRDLCPACSTSHMRRCIAPRARAVWPLAMAMVPYMQANLARKRQAISRADVLIAVSQVIAADLRRRAPEVAGTRIDVIPNPVNLEIVEAARGTVRPWPVPYAVYIGKLAPNKGTRWLIDVARMSELPWPLLVVGDGPDRSTLEEMARSAGLDVQFLGWRPREQALQFAAHAELLVFPSLGPESLSRVLLEAGALGRAIAAMNTGGTGDIVIDGVTGLLSNTPDELVRDVARLAVDADLRARLGAAVCAHVARHFSAPGVVSQVEAVYESLIGRRRG